MMGATWVTKGMNVLQIPALRDWLKVANIPYLASPIGRQVSQFMACHLLSHRTGGVGKSQLPSSLACSPLTLNILYTCFLSAD